ncbi:CAP domain-containing protein [Streptomyces sp. NA02950]|uniref:CAP domain-containing protein n=1 Tax=Streptomyces sp. NA02950 TaxID=2742137 RepID=UPI0015924833|nr:CAP domain-containing protein [Streptomyces sp. NA02950]QKV96500.1 CAP domain-containing protein [Streptomyces sp. NA02950]
MSKHRSKKTHHRKIAIAAVAVAAVGVPSVAMACLGGQDTKGSEARGGEWTTTAGHSRHTDSDKGDHRGKHRADRSRPAPSASSSASASPRTAKSAPASSAAPSSAAPTRTPAKTTTKASTKASSPSSAPPASTTAGTASGSSDLQDQIVELVNKERAKVGCKPVTVDAKLTKAAQAHSEDMAEHSNMSHTGSDGSSPGDRIERAGYSWSTYGENVAYGYSSPESVMEGWMNSSGHKANILNCDFKEIGVGHAQPGHYWTQDFATAR